MRVRLKVAATVPVVWDGKTVRHDWMPAGSEVDLPEEDFHPDVHEDITPKDPPAEEAKPTGNES